MSSTQSNLPASYNPDGTVNEAFKEVTHIKREELRPINNPTCQHVNVVRTPSVELPGYEDVHCNDCHRGFFVPIAKP